VNAKPAKLQQEIQMQGRVVVITGGTSGIGKVAAEKLAFMGARIVLVARDRKRGQSTMEKLRHLGPGNHSIYYADLSRLNEMKGVADRIAAAESRIDVLINNAGAMFGRRHLTEDGLEQTFALNHMSYFVLGNRLYDSLRAAAPARLINTASDAHRGQELDFSDLQSAREYQGFPAYGRTKLCNILHTSELSRRWAGTGVTANSLHHGFVNTRFGGAIGGVWGIRFAISKFFALSPEKGAETMIYLASSQDPSVVNANGLYFNMCRAAAPSLEARDAETARRLWDVSEKLAGN
jgi:NAD(P)-dependent dehydrogenase (short-subunit alcohol dehydrogenase family)